MNYSTDINPRYDDPNKSICKSPTSILSKTITSCPQSSKKVSIEKIIIYVIKKINDRKINQLPTVKFYELIYANLCFTNSNGSITPKIIFIVESTCDRELNYLVKIMDFLSLIREVDLADDDEDYIPYISDYIPKIYDFGEIDIIEHTEKKLVCFTVYDYYANKDFFKIVTRQYNIDLKYIIKHCYEMVKAINELHNRNIFHRDIKPENFVYCEKTDKYDKLSIIVAICDLNQCYYPLVDANNQHLKKFGSYEYTAPEKLINKFRQYDFEKVDIWALGCVLFEMITGSHPYYENDLSRLKFEKKYKEFGRNILLSIKLNCRNISVKLNIIKDDIKTNMDDTSFEIFKNLMSQMITINPEDRISVKDVLQHPFFKGM